MMALGYTPIELMTSSTFVPSKLARCILPGSPRPSATLVQYIFLSYTAIPLAGFPPLIAMGRPCRFGPPLPYPKTVPGDAGYE